MSRGPLLPELPIYRAHEAGRCPVMSVEKPPWEGRRCRIGCSSLSRLTAQCRTNGLPKTVVRILTRFTTSIQPKAQQRRLHAASNAAFPIARFTARCRTTSPTGCVWPPKADSRKLMRLRRRPTRFQKFAAGSVRRTGSVKAPVCFNSQSTAP